MILPVRIQSSTKAQPFWSPHEVLLCILLSYPSNILRETEVPSLSIDPTCLTKAASS